jgi:hypothetical protein
MPSQPPSSWTTWPPTSPNTAFGCEAFALNVLQQNAADPSLIVDPGLSAHAELELRLGGKFAKAFATSNNVGTAQFYYEGYGTGAGNEGTIGGPVSVPANSAVAVQGGMESYLITIKSPNFNLNPGVYKLAVTVSFGNPYDIFAFHEGTAIEVR